MAEVPAPNIRKTPRLDSSTTSVRLAARTRLPDVHSLSRVWLRDDSASYRSRALLRMSGTCADEPTMRRSLRIRRTRELPVA